MTGKKFNEVQRELELTLSKLKAEIDPERRRALLRKMSRLLASASLAHETVSSGTVLRLLLWQRPSDENRRPNQKTVVLCSLPGMRCCRRAPLSIAGRWSSHRTAHRQ